MKMIGRPCVSKILGDGKTYPHGAKITKPCATCGKPVSRYASRIFHSNDNGRIPDNFFCNRRCHGIYWGKTVGTKALKIFREGIKMYKRLGDCQAFIDKMFFPKRFARMHPDVLICDEIERRAREEVPKPRSISNDPYRYSYTAEGLRIDLDELSGYSNPDDYFEELRRRRNPGSP